MQRQLLRWTVAPVALLALAACTVTIHISDRVDRTVTPTEFSGGQLTDADAADDNVTLSGGERLTYQLNVASTGNNEALYIALDEDEAWDEDVELRVYSHTSQLYASAATQNFFAAGSLGVQADPGGDSVAPQAITASLTCPGSCVIVPVGDSSGTMYFDVRNTGSQQRTFDVYAILRNFEDDFEPDDDTGNTADFLDGSGVEGALEALGDEDAYEVTTSGTYQLNGALASGIDYRVDVYASADVNGPSVDDYSAGETMSLFDGEFIVVRADNDRAGVAGKSRYTIE